VSEPPQTQTLKATLGLRGLLTGGHLRPGERVTEQLIASRLGVSRTPARAALMQLRQEGLLEELASGGFAVSAFTEADVFDAIEVRGTLEGLAARFAAERGVPPSLLTEMGMCVASLDQIVPKLKTSAKLMGEFIRYNDRFHDLIIAGGNSSMIERSLRSVMSLPLAGRRAFVDAPASKLPELHKTIETGQVQHHDILEAIRNREGTRAQALTIEHARTAWKYLRLVLELPDSNDHLPALSLIRRYS